MKKSTPSNVIDFQKAKKAIIARRKAQTSRAYVGKLVEGLDNITSEQKELIEQTIRRDPNLVF